MHKKRNRAIQKRVILWRAYILFHTLFLKSPLCLRCNCLARWLAHWLTVSSFGTFGSFLILALQHRINMLRSAPSVGLCLSSVRFLGAVIYVDYVELAVQLVYNSASPSLPIKLNYSQCGRWLTPRCTEFTGTWIQYGRNTKNIEIHYKLFATKPWEAKR